MYINSPYCLDFKPNNFKVTTYVSYNFAPDLSIFKNPTRVVNSEVFDVNIDPNTSQPQHIVESIDIEPYLVDV